MASTVSCTAMLVAVVSTRRRRRERPTSYRSSFRNQDKDITWKQRCGGPLRASEHYTGFRKGWLKPYRLQNVLWSLFCTPESSREAKVSDRKDASTHNNAEDNSSNHANSLVEELLPSLDAVIEATELVVETVEVAAQTATELVVETVEVAAQTVSSVGEMEGQIPLEEPSISISRAVKTVVFWVCSAITFGLFIWLKDGSGKASEFFTGYIVEQSLSVDNLFVFVIIFKFFHVPLQNQSRILTYGISGAIVFRATMILLGVATIQKFEAVNLFFASILIFTSYKLLTDDEEGDEDLSNNYIVNTCKKFIPVTDQYDGNKFFTKIEGSLKATPLFLTLAVIELSDIAFAVDSIPAVFGITRDAFIVFSSNVFAILGLRSLYTLISSSMGELEYIQPSVAVVLGFIGSKMVVDFFGYHIPREVSLGMVVSVLGLGIGLSLWKKENSEEK